MSIKGVVFDFGFTLFYFKDVSLEKYLACYNKGLEESIKFLRNIRILNDKSREMEFKSIFIDRRNQRFKESRITNLEFTTLGIFEHVLDKLDLSSKIIDNLIDFKDLTKKLADIYHSYEEREWIPFPKTIYTLDQLSKINDLKIALLSNHPHHNMIVNILKKHHVYHLFDVVLTSAKFGKRKPDPSIFLHIIKKMGLTGQEQNCFMCGDEHADIVGGHAIGLKTILCERAYKFPSEKEIKISDYFNISEISEILDLIHE
ncbi:MAG: HAD family hydrolase [Candidatus Lokiarchaeota archaeon]|nr:HAD family hydrolase [Candidatus Lokiarchaeota archaeon]